VKLPVLSRLIGGAASALGGWKGYAAAAGVAFVLGFGSCWQIRDWVHAAAERDAARHVVKEVVKQDQASAARGLAHASADTALQDHGRKVAQEIPRHVTPEIDRAFPLPVGAVRLLNDAIGLPAVPDPPGQPDDARSAVALSDGVSVLADDVNACRRNGQQLTDLQAWIRDQQALARADGR
jgi:hypothetical protein